MIEKWLADDIQKSFDRGYLRFVICDPKGEAAYLCEHLPKSWTVIEAHTALEELEAKYQVEKNSPQQLTIFYTRIPVEDLSFLMEYAMIDGHLDLTELHQFIKKKVHDRVGLNLSLSNEELLTAAKVSVGKGKTYWMDLGHKGSGEIFDLRSMLVEFLHDPKVFTSAMDAEVKQAFLSKVQAHIGQQAIKKPVATIAKETANFILHGLVQNEIDATLLHVYHQWIDSATFQGSLKKYISQFEIPVDRDIWSLHPDHPFASIDRAQIAELAANLGDEQYVASKLSTVESRARNKCARVLQIDWWPYMLNLVRYDNAGIKTISTFDEAIRYYKESFYKLDRNIRKLYAQFLSDERVIQPLQDRYEAILKNLLNKWYEHFADYKETQSGLLHKIIHKSTGQTAIIVGDGINYEVAREVVERVASGIKVKEDYVLADLPSVTDNNMSRLYLSDGSFSDNKQQREQRLNGDFSTTIIKHIYLEKLNQSHSECEVLVCSYKDIDDLAEKMQQKALKYFDTIVDTLAEKISELSNLGFSSIYLVSDHGFVLSGLLSNADKVEFSAKGKSTKSERFIACEDKQNVPNQLIQIEKRYHDHNYLLFSKNLRPFKTTGSYGYAHGGASPQELIVPLFHFQSAKSTPLLTAMIENKQELRETEGQNFQVKVKAGKSDGNLFKSERKCHLKIFAAGQEKYSSDTFTLISGQIVSREFTFGADLELTVYLIDATSQEQLDKALVKQATGRDLGGLL